MNKTKYLKLAIIIFAAAWLQLIILPSLWFLGIKPDLLLMVAVAMALRLKSYAQLITLAFLCGLLKDIYSTHLFGFNAIMFCVYGSLVHFFSRSLYKETPWLEFAFLSCATLAHYCFLSIIFFSPYILIGILEAVINCVFLALARGILRTFPVPLSNAGYVYAHK